MQIKLTRARNTDHPTYIVWVPARGAIADLVHKDLATVQIVPFSPLLNDMPDFVNLHAARKAIQSIVNANKAAFR